MLKKGFSLYRKMLKLKQFQGLMYLSKRKTKGQWPYGRAGNKGNEK